MGTIVALFGLLALLLASRATDEFTTFLGFAGAIGAVLYIFAEIARNTRHD